MGETIQLTLEERAAVIRMIKEKHPGASPDADLEGFFKIKPLTFHFYAMVVRGLLKDWRAATDTYLHSLSNGLLEILVMALGEFLSNEDKDMERKDARERGVDLITVLILLIGAEKRKDRRVQLAVEFFDGMNDELVMFLDRLAGLTGIETLRRVGVVQLIDRYTLLKTVTDKQPRRITVGELPPGH